MDNPTASTSMVSSPVPDQSRGSITSSPMQHSDSTPSSPTSPTTLSPAPASSSSSVKILKPAAKGVKQQQRQHSPSSSSSLSAIGSNNANTKNQGQAQNQTQRRMILQNSVSAPAVGSGSTSPSTNGHTTPPSTTLGPQPTLSRVSSSSSASVASSSTNSNGGGDTQVDPQILEALKSKDRLYVLKLGEIMEGLIKEGRAKAELTPSTSYQRLLVHRCSGYYKLTPESDTGTKSIFVHLNTDSRVPPRRLCELIPAEEASLPAFKIMRRSPPDYRSKSHSHPSSEGGDLSDPEPSEAGSLSSDRPYPYNRGSSGGKKRLTIEEREVAYNQARSRIFMGFDENASATSNASSGGKDRDMSASSSSLSLASRTSGSASAGGSSVFGDFGDESSTNASEWSGSAGGPSHSQSGHSQTSQQHQSGRRGGAAFLRSSAPPFHASSSSSSRAPSPAFGLMYEMPPQGYDPALGHDGHAGYMPPPQYYYPPYPVPPPPPHAYAPGPYGYYGPGAYGAYGEGGGGEDYYASQGQAAGQTYGGYGGYYWPPPPQGQPGAHQQPGSGSQGQPSQQPGTPQQQPAQAHPCQPHGSPGTSGGSSPAPQNAMIPGPIQHQSQPPQHYPHHPGPYAPYMPYGYPYYPPPPTEDVPLYPGQVGVGVYPGYAMPPPPPVGNERRLWTPSNDGSQASSSGSGRDKEGGRRRGKGGFAGPGQRDDNARSSPGATRRQSDNSSRSDEASSIASYSSSTSSSSIRTASSQHPLPPRPDWAVGLTPQVQKPNGAFGAHSNVHGSAGLGLPNSNIAQPPTSISDFPPLIEQGQAQEPRKPVVASAWNNAGVKSVSGAWRTGGEGEGGYERPPPKGPTELFNPRVGHQNGTGASQHKATNGTGSVRGAEGLAVKMQGMSMKEASASPAAKDVTVSS